MGPVGIMGLPGPPGLKVNVPVSLFCLGLFLRFFNYKLYVFWYFSDWPSKRPPVEAKLTLVRHG